MKKSSNVHEKKQIENFHSAEYSKQESLCYDLPQEMNSNHTPVFLVDGRWSGVVLEGARHASK